MKSSKKSNLFPYVHESAEGVVSNDYETMRNFVFAKLINLDGYEQIRCRIPHKRILDMLIVFYVYRDNDPDKEEIWVTKEMLKRWQVSEEVLLEDAICNTQNIMGESMYPLSDLVDELLRRAGEEARNTEKEAPPLYVLSNLFRRNGAICMLYAKAMQELSEMLVSDLFIIPSSVHEVILVPAAPGITQERLDALMEQVNENEMKGEEILTSHTYLYSRALGRIVV